jgi:hypothetical protein
MSQHKPYRTKRDGGRAHRYTHTIFTFITWHVCQQWTQTRHLIHAQKFTWVNVILCKYVQHVAPRPGTTNPAAQPSNAQTTGSNVTSAAGSSTTTNIPIRPPDALRTVPAVQKSLRSKYTLSCIFQEFHCKADSDIVVTMKSHLTTFSFL